MRRLMRWAWNVLAALSLLLFVAACVLWARSHVVQDVVWWRSQRGTYLVNSAISQFMVRRVPPAAPQPSGVEPGWHYRSAEPADLFWQWPDYGGRAGWRERAGFAAFSVRGRSHLIVPYWFVLLLSATLPIARLVGSLRRGSARVTRTAWHACVVLSALLATGVAAMWVRSYRVGEAVDRQTPLGGHGASSSRGRFSIDWWGSPADPGRNVQFPYRRDERPGTDMLQWPEQQLLKTRFQWGGFMYRSDRTSQGIHDHCLIAPYWFAFLLAAVLPGWWLWRFSAGRRARRRRRVRGLCPRCGYDLRATPGRCPECGAVLSSPVPAKRT